jgi:hypothetical protein
MLRERHLRAHRHSPTLLGPDGLFYTAAVSLSGDNEPPRPWLRRQAARLAGMPLRRLGLGVVALALAASGLFGGLEQVKDPVLPAIAPGQLNKGKPWNVTVSAVRVIDEAPPRLRRPGDRWLAVRATVEVTADDSRRDLEDVLQLAGVEGLLDKRPTVYLLRDNANLRLLHPGLPEELVFFWEQAAGAPVPAAIDVQIHGKKQRADSLTGHKDWLDRKPRARVRMPVEDRRRPS